MAFQATIIPLIFLIYEGIQVINAISNVMLEWYAGLLAQNSIEIQRGRCSLKSVFVGFYESQF